MLFLRVASALLGVGAVCALPWRHVAPNGADVRDAYIDRFPENIGRDHHQWAFQMDVDSARWRVNDDWRPSTHKPPSMTEDDFSQRPPHAPHHETRSIYEVLIDDHRFSKLVKFINMTDEIVPLLNSTSTSITFLALPNWAFPHKHRRRGSSSFDAAAQVEAEVAAVSEQLETDFFAAFPRADELRSYFDEDDEDDRKEKFKKVVTAVLAYHIIPTRLDRTQFSENVTYATNLTLPGETLGGEPLRVRVDTGLRGIHINHFAKVLKETRTKNGVIHAIDRPLLPPGSIFQQLFGFPSLFSVATSALERTGLAKEVEWRSFTGDSPEGSPSVTFFAPTNKAFNRLPWKLRRYLFSPYGEKALKKLMQFHVVPDSVVHSDWIYNASSTSTEEVAEDDQLDDVEWLRDPSVSGREDHDPRDDAFDTPGPNRFQRTPDPHAVCPCLRGEQECCHFFPPRSHDEPSDWNERHERPRPRSGARRGPRSENEHDEIVSHGRRYRSPVSEQCRPDYRRGDSEFWKTSEDPACHGRRMRSKYEDHRDRGHASLPPGFWHDGYRFHRLEETEDLAHLEQQDIKTSSSEALHFSEHPDSAPSHDHDHPVSPRHCTCQDSSGLSSYDFGHAPVAHKEKLTVPTLLPDHFLRLEITKYKFKLPIPLPRRPRAFVTRFFVNGQSIRVADNVARNGAVHVVDRLLSPLHARSTEGLAEQSDLLSENSEWEEWEEWLPAWAEEEPCDELSD